MKHKILLIGAGGHAKSVIETIAPNKFEIVGIIDADQDHIHQKVNGIEIIDCDKNLETYYPYKADCAFVAIGHVGNYEIRNTIYCQLKKIGYQIVNIIHEKAIIATSVNMGEGNLIMPLAVINPDSSLGNNNIINTGAIIEHDVHIGNGVHLAPGAVICGGSTVYDNAFIGAGTTIIQGISIGANSIIGAGSVVISDIPENVVALGSPARIIKRRK